MLYTVLGASGLIGRHLVKSLREQGYAVQAPSRNEITETLKHPLGHVLYCVGLTADYRDYPQETVDAHVTLLNHVVHRAQYDSLVYLSSTRVYQYAAGTSEDTFIPVQPNVSGDLYNLSKLLGESICLNALNPNTVVARLSNVISAQGAPDNFLNSLVLDAKTHGAVHFRTAPDSQKDYIALDDVVTLLPKLYQSAHRILNIASGVNTTHQAIAQVLQAKFNCQITWQPNAPTWTFPPIEIGRIVQTFDFHPTSFPVTMDTMLSQFVPEVCAP